MDITCSGIPCETHYSHISDPISTTDYIMFLGGIKTVASGVFHFIHTSRMTTTGSFANDAFLWEAELDEV